MNAGKHMITLDLTTPAGREVALDLVRWADVVCEAFTPGTMRTLGLDYEALRAVKPDVIMFSTCLMGQTGPLATYAGFGNLAAALTGFGNLVRLARPGARRSVQRVHRLRRAALRARADPRRTRPPAPDR